MQRTASRDGNMMQQLGALLLELGRTTLTLRMGQSPVSIGVRWFGKPVFLNVSSPRRLYHFIRIFVLSIGVWQ